MNEPVLINSSLDLYSVNPLDCDNLVKLVSFDHTIELYPSKWAYVSELFENAKNDLEMHIETDKYHAIIRETFDLKCYHVEYIRKTKTNAGKTIESYSGVCQSDKEQIKANLDRVVLQLTMSNGRGGSQSLNKTL